MNSRCDPELTGSVCGTADAQENLGPPPRQCHEMGGGVGSESQMCTRVAVNCAVNKDPRCEKQLRQPNVLLINNGEGGGSPFNNIHVRF